MSIQCFITSKLFVSILCFCFCHRIFNRSVHLNRRWFLNWQTTKGIINRENKRVAKCLVLAFGKSIKCLVCRDACVWNASVSCVYFGIDFSPKNSSNLVTVTNVIPLNSVNFYPAQYDFVIVWVINAIKCHQSHN